MHVIHARNVNDAWYKAIGYMEIAGVGSGSRNGDVAVVPWPVTTVYACPTERVLLDPVRDANPFFHLFEALWMLAGRDDATFLDLFVSDFSARFAQDNGIQHGAYGKRWRGWFGNVDIKGPIDQIEEVVDLLRVNKFDRQAVIQMWDPDADLGYVGLKDRPCNQNVMLRADRGALDITVTCRSNDIVYGCYGANAVHFSVLQEYLAARIGIPVGTYTQVSNNWHLYDWAKDKVEIGSAAENAGRHGWPMVENYGYPGTYPLVAAPDAFDDELHEFLHAPTVEGHWHNPFFGNVAAPLWEANLRRRDKDWTGALAVASRCHAPDWRAGAVEWLQRRVK